MAENEAIDVLDEMFWRLTLKEPENDQVVEQAAAEAEADVGLGLRAAEVIRWLCPEYMGTGIHFTINDIVLRMPNAPSHSTIYNAIRKLEKDELVVKVSPEGRKPHKFKYPSPEQPHPYNQRP